ncbi:hypothetical protein K469DRAFT_684381 [Zopfia rhizophila CBS 207.26]|uniref:Uncharacterized protein n=1 Tax=Zopfia rhizophila CBS 207.26 TaxID=1314779 RepID=A0A6A6D6Z2_9PEZI|nr:hypothetical protein K469DRAFT_684381 [Zopfia rhizophila CBS 207.26]
MHRLLSHHAFWVLELYQLNHSQHSYHENFLLQTAFQLQQKFNISSVRALAATPPTSSDHWGRHIQAENLEQILYISLAEKFPFSIAEKILPQVRNNEKLMVDTMKSVRDLDTVKVSGDGRRTWYKESFGGECFGIVSSDPSAVNTRMELQGSRIVD